MDIKSFNRWDEYTAARDAMFAATDTAQAPWFVARSKEIKARASKYHHICCRESMKLYRWSL